MAEQDGLQFAAIPGLHQPPNDPIAADVDEFYVDERPPDALERDIEDELDVADEDRGEGAGGLGVGAQGFEDGAGGVVVFATLEEWVEKWLLNVYRRSVEGHAMTWCAQWWRHPEAYLRLDALWRAWEYLRKQPATGMAVWLRDYCDPHMAVLLSETGPFKGCDPTRHSAYELVALPMLAPPNWDTLGYEGLRSRQWDEEQQR